MPQISLTDFVDIVAKAGRPKATKVFQIKERPEYAPAFDFYKPFREHLVDVHKHGHGRSAIDGVIGKLTDPKKSGNYSVLTSAYKTWWGKKTLGWFPPPRSSYSSSGVDIIVNPELGLVINGTRHIIKLYLKSDPLTGFKVEVIGDLMEFQLRSVVEPTDRFAILDVRESKLFVVSPEAVTALPMVNAELAYIASIWNQ